MGRLSGQASPPTVRPVLKQRAHRYRKAVRHLDERPNGGIAGSALNVRQIAPLNRRPLGELFLGPVLRAPEGLDSLRQKSQSLRFGYGQSLIVLDFAVEYCMIRVTIGPEPSGTVILTGRWAGPTDRVPAQVEVGKTGNSGGSFIPALTARS
jgi:hypothetical protein